MNAWGIAAAVGGVLVLGAIEGRGKADRAEPLAGEPAAHAATPSLPGHALAHLREAAQRGADASLVIANDRYRAVFSRDGLAYTPRVGGKLEPRLAWAYRARTVATDTVTRRLEAVAPTVSAAGEHVVDFARPGLVERYAGEGAGVEQIFVLPERPAGRGDVRIAGDVTFAGRVSVAGGGLRFEAPGLPPFAYAAPIAFDADQKRLPVRVDTAGSTLSLIFDGAALDGARWPVTIDPLLGVADVGPANETTSADVAYDSRRGQFLVVYDAKPMNSEEHIDIRLRRYYEDGLPVGPSVVIAESEHVVDYWVGNYEIPVFDPRIACDEVVDRCLVVWQRQSQVARIRALLLRGDGEVLGAPFSPGPFATGYGEPNDELFPRVVARRLRTHAATDPCFLVTWSENNPLSTWYAQFARVSGTGVALGETHVSLPSSMAVEADYDPFADHFLAVWRTGASVTARTVDAASGFVGSPLAVTSELAVGAPYATFDVASKRHLVGYHNGEGGLRGRLLSTGTPPIPVGDPIWLTTWGGTVQDLLLRGVAAQNGTFLTTYSRTVVSTIESRLARIDMSGASLDEILLESAMVSKYNHLSIGNGGYVATVGFDDYKVKIANAGRWATGMVQGDANDFDGDGKGDLYIYRPSTATFFVRKSSIPSGSPLPQSVSFSLGGEGQLPVVLDWDGDGLADIGVWALTTGRWVIRLSSTGTTEVVSLGHGGDIPVPGDYLGGNGDEIAVWRPRTGEWFIRERGASTTTTVVWGERGDQPVPADDDNDGKRDLCVFRKGTWLRVNLNLTGLQVTTLGQAGDTAFAGNFVGGPQADKAVFRNQTWYIREGGTSTVTTITTSGRLPVTLDWNGDGLLDVATWNETNGLWRIVAAGATTLIVYGSTGDIPAGGQ